MKRAAAVLWMWTLAFALFGVGAFAGVCFIIDRAARRWGEPV